MPKHVTLPEFIENVRTHKEPMIGREGAMIWRGFGKQEDIPAYRTVNQARQDTILDSRDYGLAPRGAFHWWTSFMGSVAVELGEDTLLAVINKDDHLAFPNGAGYIRKSEYMGRMKAGGQEYLGWSTNWGPAYISTDQETGRITRKEPPTMPTDQEILQAYAGLTEGELPVNVAHLDGLMRVFQLAKSVTETGQYVYYTHSDYANHVGIDLKNLSAEEIMKKWLALPMMS